MPRPPYSTDASQARTLYLIRPEDLPALSRTLSEPQRHWLSQSRFDAAAGDLRLLPGPLGVEAAIMGLGPKHQAKRHRFLAAKGWPSLPEGDWQLKGVTGQEEVEATLAILLSSYRFTPYRGSAPKPEPRLVIPPHLDKDRLLAMVEAEFLTRDLINTPAQDMGPGELQAAAFGLAARFGATATACVGADLITQNFPMIHAVGRASDREPRLIDLRWGKTGPRLTLVGKGVCFDTGGLNIKPSSGMLLMKKDMGGAATVLGLAQMIMALNLPLRLRVLIPAVENVISGNALKPKDILRSRQGLTVEVNDTDAEGRLVLGDALAYACEEGQDLLVSMATLTGAARVAVGPDLAPYYTDDATVAEALETGAVQGFDPVWRLPFWDPYETIIEPGIADIDNAPGWGFAGSVTAALFLRRFVGESRYLHFDIYGHTPADLPARPKGAVGQGARAVLHALTKILDL